MKKIPHKNGNIQIGCYNGILHAQTPYKGRRGSMVLNLKAPIINYFKTYGKMHMNNIEKWVIQESSVHFDIFHS